MRRRVTGAVRRAALLLWTLSFCMAPCYSQITLAASDKPEYVNPSFGFMVKVPLGMSYTRTIPPNPDHGFQIQLSPETKLWVDASSTDSASTKEEADSVTAGCRVEKHETVLLGGRAAAAMHMVCSASASEAQYEERVVLTVIKSANRSPICFQVGLRTSGGRSTVRAENAFKRLAAGFSFTR